MLKNTVARSVKSIHTLATDNSLALFRALEFLTILVCGYVLFSEGSTLEDKIEAGFLGLAIWLTLSAEYVVYKINVKKE